MRVLERFPDKIVSLTQLAYVGNFAHLGRLYNAPSLWYVVLFCSLARF
jgi:hypothetical protein